MITLAATSWDSAVRWAFVRLMLPCPAVASLIAESAAALRCLNPNKIA
jgi:hypothetical protein